MGEFDTPQERIQRIESALSRATEIVAGIGADPLEVFPNPADKERRADVVWGVELTQDQQDAFRGVMAELGPGQLYNVAPDSLELSDNGYVALFEGGQPHKMIAELDIVDNSPSRPAEFIVSASPDRELRDQERALGARLLEIDVTEAPTNELDMAIAIVRKRPSFSSDEYGDISSLDEPIQPIGFLGDRIVNIMPVRRTSDGTRPALDNKQKMELAAKRGLPVAFVTSATYQPSCELAAIQASVDVDVLIASYGANELARVKGEALSTPSIAQLGAEAHKAARELRQVLGK